MKHLTGKISRTLDGLSHNDHHPPPDIDEENEYVSVSEYDGETKEPKGVELNIETIKKAQEQDLVLREVRKR